MSRDIEVPFMSTFFMDHPISNIISPGDCAYLQTFLEMANAAAVVPPPRPKLMRGNHGLDSRVLVHDGFRYKLNKPRHRGMYWRCCQRICRAGAANGFPPARRKLKWARLELRITRLKADLLNGRQNVLQYWSAVRHQIQHFN